MLHLFRRDDERGHASHDAGAGPVFSSHILSKFLKRLRAMGRPHLLDLGTLSGANIEFFGGSHCKVHVEDLLGSSETAPAADPLPVPLPTTPEARGADDAPADEIASVAIDGREPPVAPIAAGSITHGRIGAPPPAVIPARPGTRPTRRIVLPPRTFGNGRVAHDPRRVAGGAAPVTGTGTSRVFAGRCGLPTFFGYPDESFDAVVAWDIFNFYDPESARLVTAETRRVLKPGGLVFCYFHAKRLEGPDRPRRYRIIDEKRVACDPARGVQPLPRHVYQNRDIEKMFTGLAIIELYFLQNSMREILLEKRPERTGNPKPLVRPATPKPPRFTIE
jgi:methyltransferase family protein